MSSSPEFEDKRDREGEPLESSVKSRVEEGLGRDLSGVRIHRGSEGAAVSGAEGARAVTRGQNIYFAPQEYAPGTPEGQRLLTHELAHAVQSAPAEGATADRGSLEGEAHRAAEAVAAGHRPSLRLRAAPGTALKQEATRAPTIARHAQEIAPSPVSGMVSGPGFSLPYAYTVIPPPSFSSLTLQVPEGVSAVVTPLMEGAADCRVQNAEGNRPRAVVVSVNTSLVVVPRVQLTFTRGSVTYIVVFQFPQILPASRAPSKAGPP